MQTDGIATGGVEAAPLEPAEAREPRLLGMTLAQYAGVQAGLGEEHPLDAVLANEGVDPAGYARAALAWADLLTEEIDAEATPLNDAFTERLMAAQERLGRRIEPLADDFDAWLAFVRIWAADPDPPALLARLGLRAADVIRLQRAWGRRLEEDPRLLRCAQEALATEPGALPETVVGPSRLVPPEGPPPPAFEDLVPVDDDDDEDDDDAIDGEDPAEAAVEAPPFFAPLEALVPGLAAVADVALRAPAPSTPSTPPPPQAPAPPAAGALTRPSFMLPATAAAPPAPLSVPLESAALPFARSGEAAAPPAPPRKRIDLGATNMLDFHVVAEALPFLEAKREMDPPTMPKPEAPPVKPRSKLAATSAFQAIPVGDMLPFVQAKQDPAGSTGAPPAGPVPVAPLPAASPPTDHAPTGEAAAPPAPPRKRIDLGATNMLDFHVVAEALPFMEAKREMEPPAMPKPEAPPVKPRSKLAATSAFQAIPVGDMLPFVQAKQDPTGSTGAPPAGPVPVAPLPAASPPTDHAPTLTLTQYASLCAELEVFPANAEQTFQRYGLADQRARLTVNLGWRERLQRNAAEYQEWQRLYQHYRAYLSDPGRQGPKR